MKVEALWRVFRTEKAHTAGVRFESMCWGVIVAMESKPGNEGSRDIKPVRSGGNVTGSINCRNQQGLVSRRTRWFSGRWLLGKVTAGLTVNGNGGVRDE